MLARFLRRVARAAGTALRAVQARLSAATKPTAAAVLVGALTDLSRSRPQLLAEHALLRQQLLVLKRSVKRPRCTPADRALLVLLASRIRA
jgi:hypothetical protein